VSTRILIADDHSVVRAGLRALIHGAADAQVVAEAASGEEALRLAAELRPEVVLLDISLPGMDGITALGHLRGVAPATRVLIMTMHEDAALVRAALAAGASGYIIKRALEAELITAIEAVRRGELYVHPALTRALLQEQAPAPAGQAEPLSARELEVLRLIAEGHTNRQIAAALTLSVRTVESHRASIMDKLGLRSRAELARYAAERGLIRSGK
jgi:two-component system response regulator NreC